MLAVKENIITVTLEVAQKKKLRQSLWILLDNNRSKIRVGVIYAPQENVTLNNELKIMYNNSSKQISIAQEEKTSSNIWRLLKQAHTQKIKNQQ